MPDNFTTPDPIYGSIDLADKFITDKWVIEKYVGGVLFSWGYNGTGGLGVNNYVNYSSPVQVGSMTNWSALGVMSAGGQNTPAGAIKNDGTLWMWGSGGYGGLGYGNGSNSSSPVQVGSLTNWRSLAIGGYHTAAIKTDNTLWTWGSPDYGALGNGVWYGGGTNYYSPIQIGTQSNWKQVAVGRRSTLAVKFDGTLWAWGLNDYGQLGNSTLSSTVYYSSPIQIGSLTNWKQISTDGSYCAAIKTDGTLWVWGWNTYGCLGNSTSGVHYSSPIQIGSLTNWKQVRVEGGSSITMAIKTDGTLWGWGWNGYFNSMGNGTTINYSSPVQIGALTNWKYIATGDIAMGAIKNDGTLWMWGDNTNYGEVGNNSSSTKISSPIQIGVADTWKQLSPSFNSMAITFKDFD